MGYSKRNYFIIKRKYRNCTFKVNRMFKGRNLKVKSYEISKYNSEFIFNEKKIN